MKESLNSPHIRFEVADERIRYLKGISLEMIQSKQQTKKPLKKNEQSKRDLLDNGWCTNICILAPEEKTE